MEDYKGSALTKAFAKKIKPLVGCFLLLVVWSGIGQEENDFFLKHAERAKVLVQRWKESLNRMPVGTRFNVPNTHPKKKTSFQVKAAYVDTKLVSFVDQRSFEVVSNELNAACLQCANWSKIFAKNSRLPPAAACQKLRKENAAGNKTLFPAHPETKQVGRPCNDGYFVKTTTGSLDNCYCMAEDLAESSYANDVVPVTETCKAEFYDEKTGQRFPDRVYTYEEMLQAIPEIKKEYARKYGLVAHPFVPKMEAKEPAAYYFRPHGKMKFAQYTSSELYSGEGQAVLGPGMGVRLMCPDAPERLAENKKTRAFTTSEFNSSKCPCTSSVTRLPESLSLPAMEKGFTKLGRFGENVTYKLVDESLLPPGLQRKTTAPVRRTGYGITDNSPPGDNAGFAAIRRKSGGRVGRANLGVNGSGTGSLDNPVTAAVSPAFARKYGVCQGDMLYDPTYGWLRVEGGCTNNKYKGKFLGERVDIWRGGLSKQEEGLNEPTSFVHFPAALIDKDFAVKNPGPVRKTK